MSDDRRRSAALERGGIVLGWLLKLIVSLAIVAVVVYEGGAVILAHVASDSAATDVSGEAALAYAHAHNADQAKAAATEKAKSEGASLVGFSVDTIHRTVTVTVEKEARTLFLRRLSFTRSWAIARTTRTQAIPE